MKEEISCLINLMLRLVQIPNNNPSAYVQEASMLAEGSGCPCPGEFTQLHSQGILGSQCKSTLMQ